MASVVPQPPPAKGDENRQQIIIGFTIWTVALATIFVILRVVVRVGISKVRLWWDDAFIILAVTANIIGASLDFVEIHFGFGRHQYYLNEWQIMYFMAYTWGEWIQTFLTLMCTKVSICLFLVRIPIHKRYTVPLYISVAVLIVSNVVITLLWIFQCWPVQAAWDPRIPPQYCFKQTMIYNIILAQAVISVVSDFGLALYPILLIAHLQMRRREKFGLCVLMGLGVITGACCIVRTVLNGEAVPEDGTYGGITNWFWRLFEVQLGIICACIPTLIPGYKWLKHRLNGQSKASSKPTPFVVSGPHRRKRDDVTELLQSDQHDQSRSNWGFRTFFRDGSTVAEDSWARSSAATAVPEKAIVADESNGIQKTTRVDVERAPREEPDPKPSLDVDLRPSFEDNRATWRAILESDRHTVENRV